MQYQHLDVHSKFCDKSLWCTLNKEYFLFQTGYNFFLVSYFRCMDFGDHLGMKKDILEELNSRKELPKSERGVNLNKTFKKELKRDALVGIRNIEINYCYEDNARKEYHFINERSGIDSLIREDEYSDRYKGAKEKLNKMGLEYLHKELTDLYIKNREILGWFVDDSVINKSLNSLIFNIKKEANEKQ